MSPAAVARKPQSSSGITGREGERQREREREREGERKGEKGRGVRSEQSVKYRAL